MTTHKMKFIDATGDDPAGSNDARQVDVDEIDLSEYHRAVESLRARDEIEAARLEATEFRVRLDGAQATIKRVSAERDRARSDLERRSLEIEDLRADAASAAALAKERKNLVTAANERATRAEEALADLQQEMLAAASSLQAPLRGSSRSEDDSIGDAGAEGRRQATGNLMSRMFEELRRLG